MRTRPSRHVGPALALALACLAVPGPARANGQSTHLWITEHALEHLPDGPLKQILSGHQLMLDNGTMFPDGGYPLGDDYAELAHWEPLQGAYAQWISDEYATPFADTEAAAEHLAFAMGMNSHGMADQVFDGLYMERTKVYDGEADDLDTMSDIMMMSLVPPRVVPDDWVPYDQLIDLYQQVHGYEAARSDMMTGQGLLRLAVTAVASSASDPDMVQGAADAYPWGNAHLLDAAAPGAPPCEGEVIARYWQSQFEIMQGRGIYRPVLQTWPRDGGSDHPIDSTSIESQLALVVARGLELDSVDGADFELRSEEGQSIDLSFNVFRGQDSHLILLSPQQDLQADTVYTATLAPGLETIHGDTLEGWSWTFSTGAQGPDPINPAWGEGLDGGDGEPSGGETGETGETSSETSDGPGANESNAGCACQADEPGRLPWALALPVLLGLRRRRSAEPPLRRC